MAVASSPASLLLWMGTADAVVAAAAAEETEDAEDAVTGQRCKD
jgi:hypothetical protein